MYVPEAFRITDPGRLADFLRDYPFGILVIAEEGIPTASHLPFLHRAAEEGAGHGTLLAHMARANPQWRRFAEGGEALVIFQGPHGYVSPSWYAHRPAVPTWNYAVVHAYGTPRLLEGEALWAALGEMVARHEAALPHPWRMDLPEDYRERMLAEIVGFEIPIARLEGKFKLSQNRPPEERPRIIAALARSGSAGARELGAFLEAHDRADPAGVAPGGPSPAGEPAF